MDTQVKPTAIMEENETTESTAGDNPVPQEEKKQEEAQEQNSEPTDLNVTEEESVVIEEVKVEYDPDEKILADIFEQGKTTVTTNELMALGFDTERMQPFSFQVGRYKVSRLVMISPYTIEKID